MYENCGGILTWRSSNTGHVEQYTVQERNN